MPYGKISMIKKVRKEKLDNKKIKYLHIAVIIIGAILMISCGIHSNVWFDETYSVGMANQNWSTLIEAGAADVHPLLYYFLIKIWSYIFGGSIISLRIFSIIGMIVLSTLGFTHIRKDFNEKTGLIYSFMISFLPMTLAYSSEIRMYSWAAVFVTLTAIYALRFYKVIYARKEKWKDISNKNELFKNATLFVIFSVCSAYIHYFALIAICVINLILLVAIIKARKKELIWILTGCLQFIFYLPGMIIFLKQALRVSAGFWISIKYPDIFKDILVFNYTGNLVGKEWKAVILIFAVSVTIFVIYRIIKYFIDCKKNNNNKDNYMNIAILGLVIYIFVIAIALIASCITPIFTTRYTIPIFGTLTIFIAYIVSQDKYKLIRTIGASVIAVLCIANFVAFYNENYNENNLKPEQYVNENIQDGDIFVYSDMGVGGIFAVKYPENSQYFYNKYNWTVETAYEAYSPQMTTTRDLDGVLKDYSGRIWIIDISSKELTDKLLEMDEVTAIKEPKQFNTNYKNISMVVTLVEK